MQQPTNAQVVKAMLKVFLALMGIGYIVGVIVAIVIEVGQVSEPSEFTWWDAISVSLMFLAFHWSIEWIKDLFKDDD